jgi:restriction endonuclease Mrr
MIALKAKKARGGQDGGGEAASDDEKDDGGYDEEEPADEAETEACQDVLDAIKKGDAEELGKAFHHWLQIAGYKREEE